MLSVILKSGVRGLGKAGEVARIKPGYARYLLSEGKAVRATEENMALLSEKLAVIEAENKKKLEEAQKVAESLNAECLVIVKQASDDGKLFGSVTVRDVARLLSELGYDVKPKDVFFSEYVKRTGEYDVSIELHADLVAVVKLHVVRSEAESEKVRVDVARRNKERSLESSAPVNGDSDSGGAATAEEGEVAEVQASDSA